MPGGKRHVEKGESQACATLHTRPDMQTPQTNKFIPNPAQNQCIPAAPAKARAEPPCIDACMTQGLGAIPRQPPSTGTNQNRATVEPNAPQFWSTGDHK